MPLGAADQIVRLGVTDHAEMLALARLTRPGPFEARTPLLGTFWGIRSAGRLVAMAGERLRQPGLTEISGVCVHPDHRGRFHGGRLTAHVAATIAARGERAYLHTFADNRTAIRLYERLGFRLRTEVDIVWLKPSAVPIGRRATPQTIEA